MQFRCIPFLKNKNCVEQENLCGIGFFSKIEFKHLNLLFQEYENKLKDRELRENELERQLRMKNKNEDEEINSRIATNLENIKLNERKNESQRFKEQVNIIIS